MVNCISGSLMKIVQYIRPLIQNYKNLWHYMCQYTYRCTINVQDNIIFKYVGLVAPTRIYIISL